MAALSATLSRDEWDRARRRPQDRRWIASRGWLRCLLSSELDCPPAAIQLDTDEHGKPAVSGCEIDFNLSHSAGLALYAVGRQVSIGVDVESLSRRLLWSDLAGRFYSAEEATFISSLGEEVRPLAFLSIWTVKEAYAKGVGRGLAAVLNPGVSGDEQSGWTTISLTPAAGYIGAVAVRLREVA